MATPSLTDDECRAAVEALRQHGGNQSHAAAALGLDRSTFRHRLAVAELRSGETHRPTREPPPEDVEPLDELIQDLPDYGKVRKRLAGFNADHIARTEASRSLTLKLPHQVTLLFFIGDPHMDSPGFDDRLFYAHMALIRRAQQAFPKTALSINLGDVLDHWPTGGRLGKKQHDTHLTRKEALALVRGFLQDEGINFAAHLLGNHDTWPGIDFATLMRQWTAAPVLDWAAYINLVTPKRWGFTVFAAHDMAGHSMYNPNHAMMRRAREDGQADLYVAAHRHSTGRAEETNAHRGRSYSSMRISGYKRADEYAWAKGFPEAGDEGATGLAVINPNAKTQDGRCRTFYDLEEGIDWAKFLERRA